MSFDQTVEQDQLEFITKDFKEFNDHTKSEKETFLNLKAANNILQQQITVAQTAIYSYQERIKSLSESNTSLKL